MQGAQIRKKLLRGDRVYGTHMVSFGNPVAARMATDLEFDFIFICTEHMPVDRCEVSLMCQYWAARGVSPIVRIPYPSGRLANISKMQQIMRSDLHDLRAAAGDGYVRDPGVDLEPTASCINPAQER